MKTFVANIGESLLDVAVIYFGDVSLAWAIARANDLPLTHTFDALTEVILPVASNHFAQNLHECATGIIGEGGNIWNDPDLWDDSINWGD